MSQEKYKTYRELVIERERLKQAITNTKSIYLKRDYKKAIKKIDKLLSRITKI